MNYSSDLLDEIGTTRSLAEFEGDYHSVLTDEVAFMCDHLRKALPGIDFTGVTGIELQRDTLGNYLEVWVSRARRPRQRAAEYERLY